MATQGSICAACKFGHETKPGGQKPAPGTVWCGQRQIQMAKNRQMPCFVQFGGMKKRHCVDCKKARITKPSGEAPSLGNIWCDKKHMEMNKQRNMECFEG